jgi:hypothetical protein
VEVELDFDPESSERQMQGQHGSGQARQQEANGWDKHRRK